MNCPRCNGPLTRQTVHDVDVELCKGCRGMFLQRGELNEIAQPTTGDLELSTLDGESFDHEDRYPDADCPACTGRTMRKVEFNVYSGIVLDYCAGCGGFWLDGRELERIDDEVRSLNEADITGAPAQVWLTRFIWNLPR